MGPLGSDTRVLRKGPQESRYVDPVPVAALCVPVAALNVPVYML